MALVTGEPVPHDVLHTPRVLPDGSPDHYQEALRLLDLSEEVAQRTAEGAHTIAAQAQVHATLYAAEIDRITSVSLRSMRINSGNYTLSESDRVVLRL